MSLKHRCGAIQARHIDHGDEGDVLHERLNGCRASKDRKEIRLEAHRVGANDQILDGTTKGSGPTVLGNRCFVVDNSERSTEHP